jgi:tRNA pseudouridine38-40 synthase
MIEPVTQLDDGLARLTRFRIVFSYDGTDFFGWAKQPELRTVQGVLLDAMTVIFGESEDDFGIRVAGRTDAGVHALNQQAHFELSNDQLERLGRSLSAIENPSYLANRLNGLLPSDVRIHSVSVAPEGFDARFSAIYRRYRYRIADATVTKNPLQARYTLWVDQALDELDMQAAALGLLGLNDFASFCRSRPEATTIRELREVVVSRNRSDDGVIEIELLADAFCHNMVRSIVGALVAVGEGRATADDVKRILDRASRTESFKVVAPHGLTLLEIGYPADSELASQAEKARNMRSLDSN